jgi:hypothetical protein
MTMNLKRELAGYFTGLDLGQSQDFTAIAILEKFWPAQLASDEPLSHYEARHLERFPLGTSYTQVCARLARLFEGTALAGSRLAIDQTGVGRPVVDMLRRSGINAEIRPITITGGHKATLTPEAGWLVPKKELVSTLQVVLQARRIKVAPALSEAKTLVNELMNFRVKITPACHETFGAWREGLHDDLVLAVAIAVWEGERCRPTPAGEPMVLGTPPAWMRRHR